MSDHFRSEAAIKGINKRLVDEFADVLSGDVNEISLNTMHPVLFVPSEATPIGTVLGTPSLSNAQIIAELGDFVENVDYTVDTDHVLCSLTTYMQLCLKLGATNLAIKELRNDLARLAHIYHNTDGVSDDSDYSSCDDSNDESDDDSSDDSNDDSSDDESSDDDSNDDESNDDESNDESSDESAADDSDDTESSGDFNGDWAQFVQYQSRPKAMRTLESIVAMYDAIARIVKDDDVPADLRNMFVKKIVHLADNVLTDGAATSTDTAINELTAVIQSSAMITASSDVATKTSSDATTQSDVLDNVEVL